MPVSYTTLSADVTTAGSLKYMVRHSILSSDYCIERAQEAVYAILRVREMVARRASTIVTGATSITVPDRMLEPLAFVRTGSYKGAIDILDHEHFEQRIGDDDTSTPYEGTPTECTFDKSTFYFNATADQDYPYRLWYMQRPTLLTSGTPTNEVTDRFGHIIEAMCLHYAWLDRDNDQKANDALQKAMGFITKANEEYDMFRQSIRTEAYWSN